MGPTNIATNNVGVAILGAGLTVNNKTNEAVFGVPAAFIEATNNKLNVTGTLTGSGSGLTSLNAANLNGQVPFANGGSAASSQAGFITAAFGTTNFIDNSFAPGLPTNTASGNFVDQLSLTTGSGARWLRYWTGGAWGNNFTFGPNAMIFFATDNNELFWASNGVDNCMELRNFDPAHFSAVRFVDAAGNETGAVGYGNTNALIYADMDYFESFGLQKPIYFVAGGGVIGGMAKTTGDFIWNDNNTNAFFWVRRSDKTVNLTNGLNVSGTIRAGTGAAGGGSSGGRGVTLSTGYLDSADFDPSEGGVVAHDSAHVHGTNFVSNVRNTLAAGPISFDASGAGSGMNYETSSPGGIAMLTFGISSAYCFCTTSAAQGWGGFPSVDIGTDIANGNTIGNAMLKPHGSFGTDTKSKGTNYTATMGDSVLLLNVSAKTITLPDATSHCAGRIYTVKLTVSGTGTVATTSSQNIDGATTYSLSAQYKYVTVQSDGTQWWIIANN